MQKDIIKTTLNTIKRYDMLEEGQRVLVAVSGGPDSVFLLHALNSMKDALKIKLYIGNLDHGIRGRASQIDSEFTRHLAESFNIPFIYKKIDPAVYGNKKFSKEEIAREHRYDFLIKSAKRRRIDIIATGHTLDDHVETILMRIIKGTTLRGIMGIPPVRFQDGIKIIRPLIDMHKGEIEDFLKADALPYRTDHTNLENIYFRNEMRNRVLPYLSRYNPRIKYALMNLADNLREDFEFIEEERNKRRLSFYSKGGRLSLKLKDVIVQPRALRREVIKDALEKAGSNIKKLSYKHWRDVDNFIKMRQKGKAIDLPGGVRIKKIDADLVFFKLD